MGMIFRKIWEILIISKIILENTRNSKGISVCRKIKRIFPAQTKITKKGTVIVGLLGNILLFIYSKSAWKTTKSTALFALTADHRK